MLRVWIISALSCLLASAWYFYHHLPVATLPASQPKLAPTKIIAKPLASEPPATDVSYPSTGRNLARANQEYYRQWLARGVKAEKQGNPVQAARCYSWALLYHDDSDLQQRLRRLDDRLQRHRRKVVEHSLLWENALRFERAEKYRQALELYQKLASTAVQAGPWQTKIEYCRTIIQTEHQLTTLAGKIEALLIAGFWLDALNHYQKFFAIAKARATIISRSIKLQTICQQARQKNRVVRDIWARVEKYLAQKRSARALMFVRTLATDLPRQGLLDKLKAAVAKQMVFIPAGPFIMGSNEYSDESPQQQRMLPAYYLDRYEVSNEQYLQFVLATGHRLPASWQDAKLSEDQKLLPVVGVSWHDATEYAHWSGKRLPTETEWEKAARGTDGRVYPWGNEFHPGLCNCLEANYQKSIKIGSFRHANSPYGCCDMIGNVLEWTESQYSPYPGCRQPFSFRPDYRVARGGSWYYRGKAMRISNRYPFSQSVRLVSLGFRCAIDDEDGR